MQDYDNWESLIFAANKKCRDILDKDVAPVVKEIITEHIDTDIYARYTQNPESHWNGGGPYERRYALKKLTIYYTGQNEITITSDASASPSVAQGWNYQNEYPGAFFMLLEKGDLGFFRKGFPRPAITNAQREVNRSQRVRDAIQNGLLREFEQ